jgi:hypothetical protein
LEEALQIQRESEIIELTGWDFETYDRQPADRLARMMFYKGMKNSLEQEKQKFDSRGGGQ